MIIFQRSLLLSVLSLQLFLALSSLQHQGLTYDETRHFSYGVSVLHGAPQLDDVPEMPFSALNALFTNNKSDIDTQVKTGRFATVFFLLGLSLIVFCWSKELYGTTAALFSLLLVCLDPNLIAHGHLVTDDIYAAFGITLALYCYWKFLKYGGYQYAVLSAVTLGISQLAKYTSLYLYPIFLFIVFSNSFPVILSALRKGHFDILSRLGRSFLKYFSIFFLINILIINAGYGFNKPLMCLKDYSFKSQTFKSLQTVPILNSVPLPLPYPYIEGIDIVKYINDTGATYGNTYLLGHLHSGDKKGFIGYYFIVILFKTPIAALCIILMALINYWRTRRKDILKDEGLFLLFPAAFYLMLTNFFCNLDIGIRYILFIYPMLYVFCGSLFVFWVRYSLKLKVFFVLLMLYLAGSVFSYFPHYIAYFNELVWDRKMAYKILADSNLDWGGDDWYLNQYLSQHPENFFTLSPYEDKHVILKVNDLVGVFDSNANRVLREHFKPVDQIAYSYLVYDIKASDIQRLVQGHD